MVPLLAFHSEAWGTRLGSRVSRTQFTGCHEVLDIKFCGNLEDAVPRVQMVETRTYRFLRTLRQKGKGHFCIRERDALFAWVHRESGDHAVYRDLLDFLSREVEEDANSMKRTREVREEQFLARANEKGDT